MYRLKIQLVSAKKKGTPLSEIIYIHLLVVSLLTICLSQLYINFRMARPLSILSMDTFPVLLKNNVFKDYMGLKFTTWRVVEGDTHAGKYR